MEERPKYRERGKEILLEEVSKILGGVDPPRNKLIHAVRIENIGWIFQATDRGCCWR
jgi:hypothetical protein